ncbi:MAG: LysR family transcriptional regulator [Kangiellaceae bacterium]|nr:LysR family transcriptional regulator [Kangiellaceae bacterium]
MARRVPPLKSLRAFEAAGRHLSFTRAADELFVTQAAISHQIKSLEEYLGLPLFIRYNRKLLLTDEGQNYWPKIRNMFESLIIATDQLKFQLSGGPLTVSVVPTFATSWLIPRLSDFNKTYPEIEVRLKASDDSVDFLQEDVDLAIYYEIADYPGQYSVRLLAEQLTPLCSPSFLDGDLPLNTPKDLKKHNRYIILPKKSIYDHWKNWIL